MNKTNNHNGHYNGNGHAEFKEPVAVIGLGYVGLPLALLADKKGYPVLGVDVNNEKVEQINEKTAPYMDAEVSEQLRVSSLKATSDFSELSDVSTIVICVPTPVYENNMPNLEPIKEASKKMAPFIKEGQLVVLESTVNPGVSEDIILPILEEGSGLRAEKDFYLAHCPERINPGDKKWNIENINRVVGALSKEGLYRATNFYRSIISGEIKPMGSIKEAEAIKVVENTFRDINIAFVNELAMSFSHLGIDVVNVINGAATKPFAFMKHYPGCGVGGHCIPVDPHYLIEYAKENGFHHKFLSLAREINSRMPKFTAGEVVEALKERDLPVENTRVAVLGLAYKPEVDDCRESPAFEVIKHLKRRGLKVASYDPFVPSKSSTRSLETALKRTKAVVITTAHKVFKRISPEYLRDNGVQIVIDGRNCLNKNKFVKAGILYKGIGR